jgi:oxalate decarboxylase/phosphoglucose isomerase-like protein (cupin superfamily)
VAGSLAALLVDSAVPGADLYSVIVSLEPGAAIPLHWHPCGELQFILTGHGLFIDAEGATRSVSPHDSVFSPPGPDGAHGFTNTGPLPLAILCVYPSVGGQAPSIIFVDGPGAAGRDRDSPAGREGE